MPGAPTPDQLRQPNGLQTAPNVHCGAKPPPAENGCPTDSSRFDFVFLVGEQWETETLDLRSLRASDTTRENLSEEAGPGRPVRGALRKLSRGSASWAALRRADVHDCSFLHSPEGARGAGQHRFPAFPALLGTCLWKVRLSDPNLLLPPLFLLLAKLPLHSLGCVQFRFPSLH